MGGGGGGAWLKGGMEGGVVGWGKEGRGRMMVWWEGGE